MKEFTFDGFCLSTECKLRSTADNEGKTGLRGLVMKLLSQSRIKATRKT